MTKHTPGPWWLMGRCGDYRYVSVPHWEDFARVVVRVDGQACEKGEANARLIAAAPDMLAALRQIECDVGASLIGNPFAEIERLRSVARAALAKAEGEAA